jgi:glutamate formiminotransferase/formiminotetrahydrofolate cyclodeaminase
MQEGLHTAIRVPLTVSRLANSMWPYLKDLAQIGNINCRSDLQVTKTCVKVKHDP